MSLDQDLPKGWTRVELGAICREVRNGISTKPQEAGGLPILRISSVRPMKLNLADVRYLSGDHPGADLYRLAQDDLLFTRYNGNRELVGACARVPATSQAVVYPDKLIRVRLEAAAAVPAYVERAVHAGEARQFIDQKLKTSAGQIGVSGSDLKLMPLLLPPLPEQQRIADKLDTVLARVDAVNERLARVAPLLKRFRQSVLAAATSGRLTEDFRRNPRAPSENVDKLPQGWQRVKFKDICTEITVGFVGKMSDQYVETGIPFLRSMNVRPFRFDATGLQFISASFHQQIAKSRLRPGDLAIVRSGAPGVCCVVPNSLTEANCSDLVIARPGPALLAGYGCIYMNSSFGTAHVASKLVGVAQAHFNVASMKETPIPLPPLAEQTEIVRRVGLLFAFADRLEARLQSARTAASRLSPSLLAKAFRGELVPQDPNDEPASELVRHLTQSKPVSPAKGRKRQAA